MTMRIDAHTHVFTLRSILTREAIRVMTQRILDAGAPKFMADAVEELLSDQLEKPNAFDERRLLRGLITKLTGISSFNKELAKIHNGNLRVDFAGDLDMLSAEALSDLLTRFASQYKGGGFARSIINVVETLRQSMKPTITDVARDLLESMQKRNPGDDCVIASLMMDIYHSSETAVDRKTYESQIAGTTEAVLQLPGRILPFFGVHPDRPGHLDALKQAVETGGFVGVKLYPSLGYSVNSPTMQKVYEYCVDMSLPVLLHCGHGGFYRTKDAIELCNPLQWEDVLQDPRFANLRVCFAHFGGWEALGKEHCLGHNWDPNQDPKENWGLTIFEYLQKYPNVFTDLAKHVEMLEDPAHAKCYFDTMRTLIDGPVGKRILFGTDAWLLRLDMPFDEYWKEWMHHAGTHWGAITVDGPLGFLGFAAAQQDWAPNIKRYVEFVRANRSRVGAPPAPWLAAAIDEPFSTDRDPPDWNFKKFPVRDSYQFLGKHLSPSQRASGYKQHRTIKLKELAYHDGSDPNFKGRCRDMARQFVDFMDQRAPYARGHSFGSTVDMFVEIFEKGDLRLCDVATTMDSVLDYPEHVT